MTLPPCSPLTRLVLFVASCVVGVALFAADPACTPQQAQDVAHVAPPLLHAGCVVIHALDPGSKEDGLCATADELAPFLGELAASRRAAAPPADAGAGAMMARSSALLKVPPGVTAVADLGAPRAALPRRECSVWVVSPAASSAR